MQNLRIILLLAIFSCFSYFPTQANEIKRWEKKDDGSTEIYREPASWGLTIGSISALIGGSAIAYYLPELPYKIAGGFIATVGALGVWNAKRRDDLVDKPLVILDAAGIWYEQTGFIAWHEVQGYDICQDYCEGNVSSRYLLLELTNKRYVYIYTFGAPIFRYELAVGPKELINLIIQYKN